MWLESRKGTLTFEHFFFVFKYSANSYIYSFTPINTYHVIKSCFSFSGINCFTVAEDLTFCGFTFWNKAMFCFVFINVSQLNWEMYEKDTTDVKTRQKAPLQWIPNELSWCIFICHSWKTTGNTNVDGGTIQLSQCARYWQILTSEQLKEK